MIEEEVTAIQKLQQGGNSPEDWLEFLAQCQSKTSSLSDETCRHLVYLYGRAVNQISAEENRKNFSYARLLVNFAQLQMRISEDEARSTFQLARNNAKHFAIVYVAWAQFELSTGNKSKSRSLLRKGKDFGAQPLELLRRAFENLLAGKKDLMEECEDLTGHTSCHMKHKSSESSVDSSPISTGDESSTSTGVTDTGTATVDNTSAVISFKLPGILQSCGKRQQNFGRSNSSSSDEADTIPLQVSAGYRRNCSMSTQKPLVKSTPDFRSGTNSLAGCMNLSVRRKKTRRGLGGLGGAFGLPMRVKMPLPEVEEPVDELEGINELEATVHESKQSAQPGDMKPAPERQDELLEHRIREEKCELSRQESGTYELQRVVPASETVHKVGTQCVQTMPENENPSVHYSDGKELSKQNSMQTAGSITIQRQQSHPSTSNVSFRGSIPQQNSYSGQLNPHVYSGQLSAGAFVPGYPPREQFVSPAIAPPQASRDMFVVNGHAYQKLETIGRGGSSKVFRAFDGKRICAIKYVNLEEADDAIVQSYINEITLLKRLQGNDNIIKLFDWELSQENSSIVLVMECGSIDLAGFLRKNRTKISEGELQGYWRQMLESVHVTHEQGIIHSDLKPANFLLVEGRLKLIDFGIANALQGDKTSIERETQVGTLNFMSPEAFQDISHASRMDSRGNPKPKMKIGRPSDVWSLGCILYMMVYGKTPFQHITNHIVKLQCIMDPSHTIEFPDIKNRHLLDVIKGCLHRSPRERYDIPQLLGHPFMTSPSLDEDKLFHCLMEFAKVDVNSPRSIRAVSKSLCEQLLTGGKIQIPPAVPRPPELALPQHAMPSDQVPGAPARQPLAGIDVQALRHAQGVLKPPSVSGSSKYMRGTANEQNKENEELGVVLKRELAEKYRNALPINTPESTFEQSWNTTTGR